MNDSSHSTANADVDQNRRLVRTRLHGVELLFNSRLNKGTAFSEAERDAFGLHGLLPPHIGTLEDQRERRKRVLDSRDTAFGKYSNMRDLQDNNETLPWAASNTTTADNFAWYQNIEPYIKSGIKRDASGAFTPTTFYTCPSYDNRSVPMAARSCCIAWSRENASRIS